MVMMFLFSLICIWITLLSLKNFLSFLIAVEFFYFMIVMLLLLKFSKMSMIDMFYMILLFMIMGAVVGCNLLISLTNFKGSNSNNWYN